MDHVHSVQQMLSDLAFELYEGARAEPDSRAARRLRYAADVVARSNEAGEFSSMQLKSALQWLAGFAADPGIGRITPRMVALAATILRTID